MKILRGGIFPRLVALFPILFPLYLLRSDVYGIPVTFPEVVLAFMVLYFLLRERVWEGTFWRIHGRRFVIWPVILFVAAAVISVGVAPESATFLDGTEFSGRLRALGILKGWILAPIVYFYMLRFYVWEKPSLMPLALRALLFSGVLLSLHALWQVWSGQYMTVDFRASGPFESANYLSLYLAPLVVFSGLGFLRIWGSREENSADSLEKRGDLLFLAGSFLLCSAALYFTDSYAAYLAVFAGYFGGLGLFLQKKSVKARVWAGLILLVLFLGVLATQWGSPKWQQFLEFSERSSTSVRLEVYEIATTLLKENPFFGIGLGQFELKYQVESTRILGHAPFEWVMIHPHNIFLAMWLNVGLLGFVAFIWLLGRAALWIREKNAGERSLVLLMLLTILVHGLFDTPYFKNDLSFEFWMLMAFLL